jgi:outer membrane protein assembly factor BamC
MTYTNFLRSIVCLLLVVFTAGCGSLFSDEGMFRDRAEDYKEAPEPPVIEVPQGKNKDALREIYVIPEVQDKLLLAGEFEVPRPASLVSGNSAEVVRIQKLGEQSWALVGVPPGQVWPQVRSFLAASNMQVARVDARSGIIETAWLTLEGQTLPSRFRFRMDQGVQRGTSELHVLQMNRRTQDDAWPAANSDDPEQAVDMLRVVSQYLADSAETAPVSMIAEQGIEASGKISLQETPEGQTYIRLVLPYDRAWASLGKALEDSTFEVVDKDRSEGVYYARFLGPEDDESGFFDWLWDDESAEPGMGQMFNVSMQAGEPGAVRISLEPEDEALPFGKREAQSMLTLIKGNID